jgi:predicted DNA-binding transcriptional regulator YafY
MGLFSDILLTVDYDRTLTAPDSTIPQRNLDAIRYFMDNGGAFTVNTGRSVPMTKAFRDIVPVNAPLLLYNGSAAYDLEKKENKVFKISRIGEVRVLEEEWTEESAHRKSITDCFRMSGFEQTPVKLEMGIMAKNLLLEEYPLAEKDLRKEGDRWILETTVSDMAGVGRFVIGLAHDIIVIDSPELKLYIRNFIQKNISNYIE